MSQSAGPKWNLTLQPRPQAKRRLTEDEVNRLCVICNEAFIVSRSDPFPSTTCNNPCKDAVDIVRDAKNDCAFDFQSTNDTCGYDLALRVLKRVKEAA